jgi:hypothetical protein
MAVFHPSRPNPNHCAGSNSACRAERRRCLQFTAEHSSPLATCYGCRDAVRLVGHASEPQRSRDGWPL